MRLSVQTKPAAPPTSVQWLPAATATAALQAGAATAGVCLLLLLLLPGLLGAGPSGHVHQQGSLRVLRVLLQGGGHKKKAGHS